MGQLFIKIAAYLFVIGLGFSVFALFANVMIATGGFPEFDNDNDFAVFRDQLLQGSIYAWLAGSFSALFMFWVKGRWAYLFGSFPVLFPLVFCVYYTSIH